MRALILILMVGGCAGSVRPAVIPKLSELPADPQKRDAVLDTANAQPGPEQKPASPKLRRAETVAATAAAVIGLLFSKTSNVTLGVAAPVDENLLIDRKQPKREAKSSDKDGKPDDKKSGAPDRGDDPVELVPWIRLK